MIEGKGANSLNTCANTDLCDLASVQRPGSCVNIIGLIAVVGHCAFTGNSKQASVVQFPSQAFTTAAAVKYYRQRLTQGNCIALADSVLMCIRIFRYAHNHLVAATSEDRSANAGYSIGDVNICQSGTASEYVIANGLQAAVFFKCYSFQAGIVEAIHFNGFQRCRKGDALQRSNVAKCALANGSELAAFFKGHFFQIFALIEGKGTDSLNTCANTDLCDLVSVQCPGSCILCIYLVAIVGHCAFTGNSKQTGVVQFPSQAFAAGAAVLNNGRGLTKDHFVTLIDCISMCVRILHNIQHHVCTVVPECLVIDAADIFRHLYA